MKHYKITNNWNKKKYKHTRLRITKNKTKESTMLKLNLYTPEQYLVASMVSIQSLKWSSLLNLR